MPDEATFNATIDAAMAEVAGKWMLTFIRHDPRSSIVVNEVPILAMWGSLDTQIDPNSNSSLMTALTLPAGRPATVKVYPGLNHLFQPAARGTIDEYAVIDVTVDPGVLALVGDWILAQPPRPPASR